MEYNSFHRIIWSAPSNIALIKYWGKKGKQIPANPSLSMTLAKSQTITELKAYAKSSEASDSSRSRFSFKFEGQENLKFKERIQKYLNELNPYFPFLADFNLEVDSKNTFPHSAGIASSASSMAALSLILCELEQRIKRAPGDGPLEFDRDFFQRASLIARLGSGSACRSLYPNFSLWGKDIEIKGSSDEYALPEKEIPYKIHAHFKTLQDWILVVSAGAKETSSSAGHELMSNHPYAAARYDVARKRLHEILIAMERGDLKHFGAIVEAEAMDLHGLMMTSSPSTILFKPETILIWHKIKKWREQTQLPVYMTLDAGPNIHLLFPKEIESEVAELVDKELLETIKGHVIKDYMGHGPKQLNAF